MEKLFTKPAQDKQWREFYCLKDLSLGVGNVNDKYEKGMFSNLFKKFLEVDQGLNPKEDPFISGMKNYVSPHRNSG